MARVCATAVVGVEVVKIEIETVVQSGFSGLNILGLPGDACRDLRERVRSSLESAGLPLPARRVVVNISPASHLKSMRPPISVLDFAVAASIAISFYEQEEPEIQQLCEQCSIFYFSGELSLDGTLKPLESALACEKTILANPQALFFLPTGTPLVATQSERILFFESLQAWRACLLESSKHARLEDAFKIGPCLSPEKSDHDKHTAPDSVHKKPALQKHFYSSNGSLPEAHVEAAMQKELELFSAQPHIALALFLAAAGRHHLLLAGEPGIGKTFAAHALGRLLPPLTLEEWIELKLLNPLWEPVERPFCSPHHSASSAALVGGASLQPGEVSLAHGGCLLLDELAEFPRQTLEALREPLDSRCITVSRAQGRMRYPAHFQLCATTNPCPCGALYSRKKVCRCKADSVQKYQQKLSGPLLDRFCMTVWMCTAAEAPQHRDPITNVFASLFARRRLAPVLKRAITLQKEVFARFINSQLPTLPTLNPQRLAALEGWAAGEHLSTRALHKLKGVAQTAEFLLGPELDSLSPLEFVEGVAAFRCLEKKFAVVPTASRRIWNSPSFDSQVSP